MPGEWREIKFYECKTCKVRRADYSTVCPGCGEYCWWEKKTMTVRPRFRLWPPGIVMEEKNYGGDEGTGG